MTTPALPLARRPSSGGPCPSECPSRAARSPVLDSNFASDLRGAKRARTAHLLHAMNHRDVRGRLPYAAPTAQTLTHASSARLRRTLANTVLPLKVHLKMISMRPSSRMINRDQTNIRLLAQKHNPGRDSPSIDYTE